ncbi:MAG: hypothetical protein WAL91_11585 [Propionicimonas sp.]
MEQLSAALEASWRVLGVALVLGAGLPAVFALGIRSLAWGAGGEAEIQGAGAASKPHVLGRIIAYLLFAFVVLAVILAVGYIAAHGMGMKITFNGIIPVFTPK